MQQMGALPRNLNEVYQAIKDLDQLWSKLDGMSLLQLMQDSLTHLKDVVKTSGVLILVFDEFFIHDNDPDLVAAVIEWLEAGCLNRTGRREARGKILAHMRDFSWKYANVNDNAQKSRMDQGQCPPSVIPTSKEVDPYGDGGVKSESDDYPDSNLDGRINKASQRAASLIKSSQVVPFDGVNNVNRYWLFKFEVQELINASGSTNNSITTLECVLGLLRGSALQYTRQFIGMNNVYQRNNRTDMLWEFLDGRYLTNDSKRYVVETFNLCRQRPDESLPAYISRFQRLALITQSVQQYLQIDDMNLILRLSSGVTSDSGEMALAMIDSLKISSFNEYCIQLLNSSNGLSKLLDKMTGKKVIHNSIKPAKTAKMLCLRCGSNNHDQSSCKKQILFPCKSCNSMDHYTRICQNKTVSNSISTDLMNVENNVINVHHNSSRISHDKTISNSISIDLMNVENNVISVHHNSMSVLQPTLVDNDELLIDISLGEDNCSIIHPALIDTGAGANFIDFNLAENLIKEKVVPKSDIKTLSQPIKVTYGNGTFENLDCYIRIIATYMQRTIDLLFFVSRHASYPLVVGRTGLKQFNMMHLCLNPIDSIHHSNASVSPEGSEINRYSRRPDTNSTHIDTSIDRCKSDLVSISQGHLVVHHHLFDNAVIAPFRCPRRSRSVIDHQILQCRLEQLEKEGKIHSAQSHECRVVLEVVLVDKKKCGPRIFPDPDIHSRYRITLDLRPLNQMNSKVVDNTLIYFPSDEESDSAHIEQQQYSIHDMLKWMTQNFHGQYCYGKIDISDAYQSVHINPSLQSLFCYSCLSPVGIRYYRWNTLPQGWSHAPLYFSIAMEYILNKCSFPSTVTARHFQDDILIVGSTEDIVRKAIHTIMDVLNEFSFKVNPNKTVVTSTLVFCGVHLGSNGAIVPSPKCPLTTELVSKQWNELIHQKTQKGKVKILQQILGRFNFLRGHLPGQILTDMQHLYSACGKLIKHQDVDLPSLYPIYQQICNFILNGCFLLHFGLLINTRYNIIITDANATGHCGILFKLCQMDQSHQSAEMTAYCQEIVKQLGLSDSSHYGMFPIRVIGSAFNASIQRQSSTYRERLSQLLALDDLYPYLDAPTILVTDNQNCRKFWHNIDEYLQHVCEVVGGSLFIAWVRFCSTIQRVIWIPRGSECVSLCDTFARTIARDPINDASTVPMNSVMVSDDVSNQVDDDTSVIDAPVDCANPDAQTTINSDPHSSSLQYPLPIRRAIMEAYINDTSTYLGVSMFKIYNTVVHGTKYDQRTDRLAARFYMDQGLLYHIRQHGSAQVYVPTGGNMSLHPGSSGSVRANILYHFHDSTLGYHRGYHKMVTAICEYYWWPSLLSDALNYSKSCRTCQLEKLKFSKYKGTIRSLSHILPLSAWVIDYAGPIDGEYIFVAICVFSCYAIFCRTSDCTATTTADVILDRLICQFGIPSNIYSDRGSAFTSGVISELSAVLGITWRASASYSPRTQGLAERLIQDIKQTCSTMDWDFSHLPLIQLYHNTSRSGSLPLSPFEVVYGIKPNISPLTPHSPLEANVDLSLLTAEARHTWLTFRSLMRDRNSDVYVSQATPTNFNVGDEVYRVFITANRTTIRTGPHRILSAAGPNTYVLHDIVYPIPDYQLHPIVSRDPDLQLNHSHSTEEVPPTPPIVGKAGDLVLFESFDSFDGSTVAVDVAEWISESNGMVTLNRFWYNAQKQWLKWDDEFVTVPISDIKLVGFHLTPQKKIPPKILRKFLGGGLCRV